MHAAGFTPADYESDPVDVWPENWLAWRLFSDLSTQWAYASGAMASPARTGLVYTSLYGLLDRHTSTPEEWTQVFHDVQVCEDAALEQLRKNM